jgi:hypothetical protein
LYIKEEATLEYPIILSQQAITELLKQTTRGPAVTIYLPTHRAATGPNITQDQIRCKNLFRKANEILTQRGDSSKLTGELSAQLSQLLENQEFWSRNSDGLLLCAVPGDIRMYYLPIDTEPYASVDDTFHLAPIFSLISDVQDYYVLAVAQHEPVLFKGSLNVLKPDDIVLPLSVAAALNIDEQSPGEHQRSAAGANSSSSAYNGRGGSKDLAEDDRRHFWRLLDERINTRADTKLPLLLAGTVSEVAEYRAVSRYPRILERSIAGSYGGADANRLSTEAAEIVRTGLIEPFRQHIVSEFSRLWGEKPDRVAHELAAVRMAATTGRVGSLLIGMLRCTTDTVRDNKLPLLVLSFPDGQAALHAIAQTVWQAAGRVVNIESALMPEPAKSAAAILRY